MPDTMRVDPNMGTLSAQEIAAGDASARWHQTVEFFPTDEILAEEEKSVPEAVRRLRSSESQDVREIKRMTDLAFLQGFIRNPKLAELALALAEENAEMERLRAAANGENDKYYLMRDAYEADLVWILKELQGINISWTESPVLMRGVRKKLEMLIGKIGAKIEEIDG